MTEAEQLSSQASVFMQAGINSSLIGHKTNALQLITAAKVRFEKLNNSTEVEIAKGWITGLKRYQQQHRSEAQAAVE